MQLARVVEKLTVFAWQRTSQRLRKPTAH
jgi:hypothetical protein